jgi:hypothetical protein
MTIAAERAALADFPELRHLVDLRTAGWTFIPVGEDGDVIELRGLKVWPSGWVDALLLRDVDDAAALRCDPDGRTTWQRDGTLTGIVEALFALPAMNASFTALNATNEAFTAPTSRRP